VIRLFFNPKILRKFFSYKIRESCKSCKRYGKKATCPPNIESVDYYNKVLSSYKNGILIIEKFPVDNLENWQALGKESSLVIHKTLLKMREELLKQGKFAVIFGAGSCKNCETCAFPCRFPEKSVVPIEATGIDVVKLVKYATKINIVFPVTTDFYRVGIILFD